MLTDIILPDSAVMGLGTTMQLTATLVPDNAKTTLTWTSDNTAVAIVDDTGLVTALNEGTANIIVMSDKNISDTCHVTVKNLEIVPNIAAFRTLEEGSNALLTLIDAQVLFKDNDDVYVRDASGSLRVSGTGLNVAQNDKLNGIIYGKLDIINRVPQLSPVENTTSTPVVSVITNADAAVPLEVKHNGTLTDDMLCDLVILKGVAMTLENKIVFAKVGTQKVSVFNTFGLKNISTPKANALSDKYFDITGILTTSVIGDTLTYVINLTGSVIEVEKPDDEIIIGDVNGDGLVNSADISAVISVMSGYGPWDWAIADVNGDGDVNIADISRIITIMAGGAVNEPVEP